MIIFPVTGGDSTELFGDDGNVKGDVRHPLPASQRDNTAGETPRLSCGGRRGEGGSCGEVVVVKTTSAAGSGQRGGAGNAGRFRAEGDR